MTFEQTKRKKGKILFFFSKAATKKQIDSSNPIKRHWHINQAKNFVSYITGKVTVISLRISWQSEFMENSKFFVSFSSSKISLAVLISFFSFFFFNLTYSCHVIERPQWHFTQCPEKLSMLPALWAPCSVKGKTIFCDSNDGECDVRLSQKSLKLLYQLQEQTEEADQ